MYHLSHSVCLYIFLSLSLSSWCILISPYTFLLCVVLQASAVSTLWSRIWRWQRVGRRTWPAVWSIMTTPPSSGQTQHSRPCFSGTRKVSWRLTGSSSRATDAALQSIPCVRFVVVEKCTKHTKTGFFFFFCRLESNLKTPSVFLCVCHLNKLLSLLCHSICPTFHASVFSCRCSVFTASAFMVHRKRYTL